MNNIYSTALAKVLKQWREDFGYNVNFIAKKLDANPHTIARFESGKGGVSLELGLKYLDFASSRMPSNAIWRQYLSALKTTKEEQNNLEISAETTSQTPSNGTQSDVQTSKGNMQFTIQPNILDAKKESNTLSTSDALQPSKASQNDNEPSSDPHGNKSPASNWFDRLNPFK